MRLATFIAGNMETILGEWEAFARSIQPDDAELSQKALLDHAEAMLNVIATHLGTTTEAKQQGVQEVSRRVPETLRLLTAAEHHAFERLHEGFSIKLMASEYKALRASVLRLWLVDTTKATDPDMLDVLRFSEAVDQALAESVQRYAELVAEAQDIFLGTLGHDLRSPLQAVSVGTACLMRAENADSGLLQLGARMHSSTVRMAAMLDDLLDYTKLRIGGGLRIRSQALDLAHVAKQVIEECLAAVTDHAVRLVASGDCTGSWDGRRIGQVFQNLVRNALQYSKPESDIDVTLHGGEHDVEFVIRNEGTPIPETELMRVFDPLHRHASREESCGSTNLGLGLYIAREIVVAHRGTITVTSTEDAGTVFKVALPKVPA